MHQTVASQEMMEPANQAGNGENYLSIPDRGVSQAKLILVILHPSALISSLTRPLRNASTVCMTPRSSARPFRRPMNE